MAHAYAPGHAHALPAQDSRDARALGAALAITLAYTVAEVAGGILTDSLALLADAGHMLSDNASIALALFALWLPAAAAHPTGSSGVQTGGDPGGARQRGHARRDLDLDLRRGLRPLLGSAGRPRRLDACDRRGRPVRQRRRRVDPLAHGGQSLNVSAAFRHVLADLLGSIGVIAAAVIILATGWLYADPLVSV